MGVAKDPKYYDENMARVNLPLELSPWRDLYDKAASLLPPPEECTTIVDIGCGTGRFARLLANRGYTSYWGIDFSELRINEAKRYVPQFTFSFANVLEEWVQEELTRFNLFVLLEVLEHISDDLKLLSALPPSSKVIFSVPNFDSRGHVRFFSIEDDVIHRYQQVLDFSNGERLKERRRAPDKMIYLFSCITR